MCSVAAHTSETLGPVCDKYLWFVLMMWKLWFLTHCATKGLRVVFCIIGLHNDIHQYHLHLLSLQGLAVTDVNCRYIVAHSIFFLRTAISNPSMPVHSDPLPQDRLRPPLQPKVCNIPFFQHGYNHNNIIIFTAAFVTLKRPRHVSKCENVIVKVCWVAMLASHMITCVPGSSATLL